MEGDSTEAARWGLGAPHLRPGPSVHLIGTVKSPHTRCEGGGAPTKGKNKPLPISPDGTGMPRIPLGSCNVVGGDPLPGRCWVEVTGADWKVTVVARKRWERFPRSLLALAWLLLVQFVGNTGSTVAGSLLPLLLLLSQPQQESQGLLLHEKQAEETGKVLASPSVEIWTIFKRSPKANSRLKFVIYCLVAVGRAPQADSILALNERWGFYSNT